MKDSGVNYKIIGAADDPYYARSERLGQILTQNLGLQEGDVQVVMKDPAEWPRFFKGACAQLGYQEHYKESIESGSKEQVLVYHWRTGTLVGDGKAFRKEIESRYGFTCDISWALCQSIAAENLELYKKEIKYLNEKTKKRATYNPKISILGPCSAVLKSQAALICDKYNLRLFRKEDVVRESITNKTAQGKVIKKYLRANPKVTVASLPSELYHAALMEACEGSKTGIVFEGYPSNIKELELLEDFDYKPDVFILASVTDEGLKRVEVEKSEHELRMMLREYNANTQPLLASLESELITVSGELAPQNLLSETCSVIDTTLDW